MKYYLEKNTDGEYDVWVDKGIHGTKGYIATIMTKKEATEWVESMNARCI
jgi:hypothetical protein